MQKKNQVILFPPSKKGHFRAIFRNGQHSVAEPGPTPSPWSIHITNASAQQARAVFEDYFYP